MPVTVSSEKWQRQHMSFMISTTVAPTWHRRNRCPTPSVTVVRRASYCGPCEGRRPSRRDHEGHVLALPLLARHRDRHRLPGSRDRRLVSPDWAYYQALLQLARIPDPIIPVLSAAVEAWRAGGDRRLTVIRWRYSKIVEYAYWAAECTACGAFQETSRRWKSACSCWTISTRAARAS